MITASVVLYNTPRTQIINLLYSVLQTNLLECLYVIDNSYNDKWRILEKEFVEINIRYIHNSNLGYGASHNIAIHEAIELGSDYHIILNPDIYFEKTVLPELKSFMDSNNDVGYILPRVTYPNGELQYLCKLLPTPFDLIIRRFLPKSKYFKKENDRYELRMSGYNKIMNPPCLSGCFMFLRLSILEKNNIFFDEKFFMYCEDFDLIRRIHSVAKTIYYPNVTIVHNHTKASYRDYKMLRIHIKSAILYFNKWGWFFDKERNRMNKQILKEIKEMNDIEKEKVFDI